jgi:predicted RNA-binding protein YlqC (UPF0109 family)
MSRETGTGMVSLVREMVLALIDDPGSARISGEYSEGCVLVKVTVAQSDLGKVIGKEGRTARSLRTIVSAASRKTGVRCELNLGEEQQRGPER